jgi:hypothetical protein
MISQTSFNPENWSFVGGICHRAVSEDYQEYGEQIFDDIGDAFETEKQMKNDFHFVDSEDARKLADKNGRYAQRGTCDHCGARFNYGAVFKNTDGEHIVLGNICALGKLGLTGQEYTDKRMRTISDAALTRAKNEKAFSELPQNLQDAMNLKHDICLDIKQRFFQYRTLSEKQKALVLKILADQPLLARKKAERDAAQAKKLETCEPVPVTSERVEFSGKIIAIKAVPDSFSGVEDAVTLKMIFEDSRGFKVFGTLPSTISVDGAKFYQCEHDGVGFFAEGGQRIDDVKNRIDFIGAELKFMAKVEASKDDVLFGFFKRATKVQSLK